MTHDLSPTFQQVTLMTLLMLTLHVHIYDLVDTAIAGIALIGIFFPHTRASPWLWGTITLTLVMGLTYNWFDTDNHMYLTTYWCAGLATTTMLVPPDRHDRALQHIASGLLICAMTLAVAWKLRAPDYLSGAFFQATLLLEPRFTPFAHILADVSLQDLAANLDAHERIRDGHLYDDATNHATLRGDVSCLALAMTWWTIGIEALIAIALVVGLRAPHNSRRRRLRLAPLLVFLATTYLIASVTGFGWLLATLAVAQTDPYEQRTRHALALLVVLITLLTIPNDLITSR